MRKMVIVTVVVVSLGLVASQVWACWGRGGGHMGGHSGGYTSDVNAGAAYQSFLNDTANLRSELAAKQGEYDALMVQSNPDPTQAGKLSQKIADIQNQIQVKAQTYGVGMRGWRGRHFPARAGYRAYGHGGYCQMW